MVDSESGDICYSRKSERGLEGQVIVRLTLRCGRLLRCGGLLGSCRLHRRELLLGSSCERSSCRGEGITTLRLNTLRHRAHIVGADTVEPTSLILTGLNIERHTHILSLLDVETLQAVLTEHGKAHFP